MEEYSECAEYSESEKIEAALLARVLGNENPTEVSWETVKSKVKIGVLMSVACYLGNGPMAYSRLLTIMDDDNSVAVKLLDSGRHYDIYDNWTDWTKEIGDRSPSEFFHMCAKKSWRD
jgi:hypothetical protein